MTAPFPVIRVLLKPGSTSTAYNGVEALQTRPPGQTVTIATLGPRAPVPVIRADLYPTILHELGHVLGLKHEHQHPGSPCFKNFKFETICRIMPIFEGSAPTDIAKTIEQAYAPRVHPIPGRYASEHPYDPASIMHYTFASRELIDPAVACSIQQSHTTISEVDQARVRKLYPATRAEQERMIQAEAAVLARIIAATQGLSPAGQVRVVAEAERIVRLGHPILAFKVPLPARQVAPEPKNGAESLQSVALSGVLPLVDTCKRGIDARAQPKQPSVPIAPPGAPPKKAP